MGIVFFWPWYTMRFLNYAEYKGRKSSCLTYCNFLKYDKSVIKNYLLISSNNVRRYQETRLIRLLTKSQKNLPNYWASTYVPIISIICGGGTDILLLTYSKRVWLNYARDNREGSSYWCLTTKSLVGMERQWNSCLV